MRSQIKVRLVSKSGHSEYITGLIIGETMNKVYEIRKEQQFDNVKMQQCLNLLDSNGVILWEDDVVKYEDKFYIIKWVEDCARFTPFLLDTYFTDEASTNILGIKLLKESEYICNEWSVRGMNFVTKWIPDSTKSEKEGGKDVVQ